MMKREVPAPVAQGQTIRVMRTPEEVEQIRADWERMQWHPNADIDFFLTIVNVRDNVLRPHVIAIEEGGEIRALLVGRVEEVPLECRLGYKVLMRPRIRQLVMIYGGAMGEQAHPYAAAFVDELHAALARGEADAVQFNGLDPESDLFLYARRRPGLLLRDYLPANNPHWQMTLPDSLEAFMQRLRPKHRSEIRRNERLFEKAFPGRIEHRIVRQRKDVPQLCQDLEAVARFTYQRGLGVGFFDNAEHRRRMALAADKSWLRAYLIYIDQQPIAFEVGMLYGSTFHLYFTGYHQDFRKHEPGTVVFMRMVDDLCRAGIQEVDCGAGDAIYKAYYGDSKSMEGSVFMFAPCLRGLRLNAARTLTLGVSRLAGALGRRAGLYQKFKKRWRMRVAPSAAGPLKT